MVRTRYRILAGAPATFALRGHPQSTFADVGGLSFWLLGAFGSLAAAPESPPAATPTYHK